MSQDAHLKLVEHLEANEHLRGKTLRHMAQFIRLHRRHQSTNQITAYIERRQSEKPSQSTINRELALLRRAFSLGFDAEPQKVTRVPKFHRFIVSEKGNERRGFVEEQQYRALVDETAGRLWLRGLLALGYTYGFRRGELLGNPREEPRQCGVSR